MATRPATSYPNAQRADTSGLDTNSGLAGHRFDYIRNSVKGVLDAYDGTVKLYIVDPDDPIVEAYAKAFPDLFEDADQMDPQLKEHFRYPEDQFRVQTNMWGSYHITDPQSFYERLERLVRCAGPGHERHDRAVAPRRRRPPRRRVSPCARSRNASTRCT